MILKYFVLAFSRIHTYMKNHRIIFLLFIAGVTISSVAFIFFYGNSLSDKAKESNNYPEYRTFTLSFGKGRTIKPEEIQHIKANGSMAQDIIFQHKTEILLDENNPESNLMIASLVNNNRDCYLYEGKRSFDENEQNQDVAIVPLILGDIDTITVEGTNYKVVGTTANFLENTIFIPFNTYVSRKLPTKEILWRFSHIPTLSENNVTLAELSNTFPDAFITDPYENIQRDKSKRPQNISTISVIYFISMISFLFLFEYMVEQNSYESTIYYIVGAKKGAVVSISLVELFFLSAVSALLGCLIHAFFYQSFFVKINIYENLSYEFADYIMCCIIIILLSMIALIPFLVRLHFYSLAQLKQRYGR